MRTIVNRCVHCEHSQSSLVMVAFCFFGALGIFTVWFWVLRPVIWLWYMCMRDSYFDRYGRLPYDDSDEEDSMARVPDGYGFNLDDVFARYNGQARQTAQDLNHGGERSTQNASPETGSLSWVPAFVREQERINGNVPFSERAARASQHGNAPVNRNAAAPQDMNRADAQCRQVPNVQNTGKQQGLPAFIPKGAPFTASMGYMVRIIDHVGRFSKSDARYSDLHDALVGMFTSLDSLYRQTVKLKAKFDFTRYNNQLKELYVLIGQVMRVPDGIDRVMPPMLTIVERIWTTSQNDTRKLTEDITDDLLNRMDGLIDELGQEDMMSHGMDTLGINATGDERDTSDVHISGEIQDAVGEDPVSSLFGDDTGSEGTIFDSTPDAVNMNDDYLPNIDVERELRRNRGRDNLTQTDTGNAHLRHVTDRNNDDPIHMDDVMDAFTIKADETMDRILHRN